jgi:hypothetical protein
LFFFRAGALALFPQGKSFPSSVFFSVEASAFDGLEDKRLPIGGKVYFHAILRVGKPRASVNGYHGGVS